MKKRCTNPRNKAFKYYGGRGIVVCPEWMTSFEAFLSDVGPRPSQQHSIDRIDNMRGYEPGNEHWATRDQQAGNTRRNLPIAFNGQIQHMSAWARQCGLTVTCLQWRIKHHWSLEKALTTPVRSRSQS